MFVTHDIDEAVKLGDQVAVFAGRRQARPVRRAGRAARPARPTTSSPTSSGRDRGYRGLSFRSSERLPLGELRTARSARRTERGWSLVLDADGRPLGWHHDRSRRRHRGRDDLVPGGSLYDGGTGSLRSALDAALSSPSGRGSRSTATGGSSAPSSPTTCCEALADARRAEAA